jgi:hypothetical protein
MYLSQALTKVRNLKSKLSRVDKIIDQITVQYEDAKPEYEYSKEIATRNKLVEEIRKVKADIQRTNATTRVVWLKEDISLTELILINADLRSDMAFVQKLLDTPLEEERRWGASSRSKDDIKKVYAAGYSKMELREQLDTLEKLKESMDGLMAQINNSTVLVTD